MRGTAEEMRETGVTVSSSVARRKGSRLTNRIWCCGERAGHRGGRPKNLMLVSILPLCRQSHLREQKITGEAFAQVGEVDRAQRPWCHIEGRVGGFSTHCRSACWIAMNYLQSTATVQSAPQKVGLTALGEAPLERIRILAAFRTTSSSLRQKEILRRGTPMRQLSSKSLHSQTKQWEKPCRHSLLRCLLRQGTTYIK